MSKVKPDQEDLKAYFLDSTGIGTGIPSEYMNRPKTERFEILRLMISVIEDSFAKEVITTIIWEWTKEAEN